LKFEGNVVKTQVESLNKFLSVTETIETTEQFVITELNATMPDVAGGRTLLIYDLEIKASTPNKQLSVEFFDPEASPQTQPRIVITNPSAEPVTNHHHLSYIAENKGQVITIKLINNTTNNSRIFVQGGDTDDDNVTRLHTLSIS